MNSLVGRRDRAQERCHRLLAEHRYSRRVLDATARRSITSPRAVAGAFATGFLTQRLVGFARPVGARVRLGKILLTLKSLQSIRSWLALL